MQTAITPGNRRLHRGGPDRQRGPTTILPRADGGP